MKKIKINNYADIPKHYTGIVEWPNGRKLWFLNGKRHRENGPAVEFSNGSKEYWLNGKRHREDGPAVIWPSGSKEYWLNGEFLNENQINQFVKQFDYPIEVAIKLTYLLEIDKS